jgi:hypothetical protein
MSIQFPPTSTKATTFYRPKRDCAFRCPPNGARDKLPPTLGGDTAFRVPAETKGRSEAESRQRGSFIEQIGGARTEPSRGLGAMASFSADCNFTKRRLPAQLISRADKRRDLLQLEAQLLPQPYPSLSKNALDGASAAYQEVDRIKSAKFCGLYPV